MPNTASGSYSSNYTSKRVTPWRVAMWLSIAGIVMNLSACQAPLKPVACADRAALFDEVVDRHLQCLEDKGNLRQQLKACQERR